MNLKNKNIIKAEDGWFVYLFNGTERPVFFWSIEINNDGVVEIKGIIRRSYEPHIFVEVDNSTHWGYYHYKYDKENLEELLTKDFEEFSLKDVTDY
jgi:hypothetical protein